MSSDEPQQEPPEQPDTSTPDAPSDRAARRAARKAARRRHGWRRLLPTWRMALGAFLLVLLVLCGGFVAGYLLVDIPSANAAATAQSNVFLYSDGTTQLASSGQVNRESVPLSQVPRTVQRAVLAAEDRDFYHESAVDPQRHGPRRLEHRQRQGHGSPAPPSPSSTSRTTTSTRNRPSRRKVKEFFIAIKLDREETKEEILEGYLNTSYFGRNAYGIQAAAQAYYHKDAEQLDHRRRAPTSPPCSTPPARTTWSPTLRTRTGPLARWNYVLDGMVKEQWLSPAERPRPPASRHPTRSRRRPASPASAATSSRRSATTSSTTGIIDEDTLQRGGYRITTTIEKPRQDAFVKAAEDQLLGRAQRVRPQGRHVRPRGRRLHRPVRPARSSPCTAASTTPSST